MMVASSVADLHKRMEKARQNAPLAAPSTTLLAAAKGQPIPLIEEAIAAGITDFGENRVQEAKDKWPDLKKKHSGVRLHLIGPLQTNKVGDALVLFDVIQTVDRPKLAEVLSSELRVQSERKSQHSTLKTHHFFIQVNTGKEPQKAGVIPEEADDFIRYCKGLNLPVIGLMCIPPVDDVAAPHFALLREIALRSGLKELSMGMSGDFEAAVRMGSTCVRIGRALFGERASPA